MLRRSSLPIPTTKTFPDLKKGWTEGAPLLHMRQYLALTTVSPPPPFREPVESDFAPFAALSAETIVHTLQYGPHIALRTGGWAQI